MFLTHMLPVNIFSKKIEAKWLKKIDAKCLKFRLFSFLRDVCVWTDLVSLMAPVAPSVVVAPPAVAPRLSTSWASSGSHVAFRHRI